MLAMIIVVMLASITGADTFRPGRWQQQFKFGLGLDLSSGTQVVLRAATPNGKPPSSGSMNQAISILESRVNGTGNSGAQVQSVGSDLIEVSVPGQPAQQVINLVSAVAQLRFRQVLLFEPYPAGASPALSASAAGYGDSSLVNAATMKLFGKLVCKPGPNSSTVDDNWKQTVGYTSQQAQWDDTGSQIVSCDAQGDKYVLDQAVVKGSDVTSVNAGLLQNSTAWALDFTLNGGAATAFGNLTTKQYNSYFKGTSSEDDAVLDEVAMVLDGDVVTAPQIQQPVLGGSVQVTGPSSDPFTQAQATQLADVLKYGSLPLTFSRLSVNSVSAQIGRASLDAGLVAGVTGLALVVAYLFVYYRGLGLVSVSSLLIAALLDYLAVVLLSRYQNFTMELPGIAGLVVAIGVTADSFIVFFERLRDEVREGKTLRPAVEAGWKRARRTILVSDTVSFLAAVVLYHFAVSDVQNFAYTLGLTTLVDVLVVFGLTKPMVTLLAGTRFYGGGHRWSGLDPGRLGSRTPWRSSGGQPGR
jgi:preprotein translocase subunit SecD